MLTFSNTDLVYAMYRAHKFDGPVVYVPINLTQYALRQPKLLLRYIATASLKIKYNHKRLNRDLSKHY